MEAALPLDNRASEQREASPSGSQTPILGPPETRALRRLGCEQRTSWQTTDHFQAHAEEDARPEWSCALKQVSSEGGRWLVDMSGVSEGNDYPSPRECVKE